MRVGFDARLVGISGVDVYTYNLLRNLIGMDSCFGFIAAEVVRIKMVGTRKDCSLDPMIDKTEKIYTIALK